MARARPRDLIVGLDVGTTKISAVIGEPDAEGGVAIVGAGTALSRGLRRGVVVSIDATVEAIKAAVEDAERLAGAEVSSAWVGVAGAHVRSLNTRGVVAVAGPEREVTPDDVRRAVEVARTISLPEDRQVIHVLPQTFVVDSQDGVRDPVGMAGAKLEVEAHVVTGQTGPVQNVFRAVNRAGLKVEDFVVEPLASAEAVLLPEERELGVIVVDLGGGTTDVALIREGAVWHTAILPFGGEHVTSDIAAGLRTALAEAEDLKRRHGCAMTGLVTPDETIDVPAVGGRKPRQLSRQILSEIIQPRVEELFGLVTKELLRAGFQDAAPAGVVLTGGTALLPGVTELAEMVFDLPVRLGVPDPSGPSAALVRSPVYATGVGLVLSGVARRGQVAAGGPAGLDVRGWRRIARWFSDLF